MTYPQQSPDRIALSMGDVRDVFGAVSVLTLSGDQYLFPNMNITRLKAVLPECGRKPEDMPSLVMVNSSMATLTVPLRIVREVLTNDVVLWSHEERPAVD